MRLTPFGIVILIIIGLALAARFAGMETSSASNVPSPAAVTLHR